MGCFRIWYFYVGGGPFFGGGEIQSGYTNAQNLENKRFFVDCFLFFPFPPPFSKLGGGQWARQRLFCPPDDAAAPLALMLYLGLFGNAIQHFAELQRERNDMKSFLYFSPFEDILKRNYYCVWKHEIYVFFRLGLNLDKKLIFLFLGYFFLYIFKEVGKFRNQDLLQNAFLIKYDSYTMT